MRIVLTLCILGSLGAQPVSLIADQEPHAHTDQRGAAVMGFEQDRTVHHFLLFKNGGAIDVAVKDAGDSKNREAIRSHLPHIAMMFTSGNFDAPMLVHDSASVPGTKVMTARKGAIRYQYAETPNGGRVTISTTDQAVRPGTLQKWDEVPGPGEGMKAADGAIRRRVTALVEEL